MPGGPGYLTALRGYTASFLSGESQQFVGHSPLARVGISLLFLLLVNQLTTGLVIAQLTLFVRPPGTATFSTRCGRGRCVSGGHLGDRPAVIAIENTRLLNALRERTVQLEAQSQEVVKLNQQLEQRVADQVGEFERMGRLRRFLPPQVADLVVASGSEKQLERHRREIAALFCDLRGFTGFSEPCVALSRPRR